MKVPIGVSARHIHLTKEDKNILFGNDYELEEVRRLSQSTDFASDSFVKIKSNDCIMDNVRILGPLRDYTQLEISITDAYELGVKPPVCNSGDLKNAVAMTIIGPNGEIVRNCTIIAARHIHINPEELAEYNLTNGQIVKVSLPGIKGGIIDNVTIKSKPGYSLELHIDLDDANAHMIKNGDIGEIII